MKKKKLIADLLKDVIKKLSPEERLNEEGVAKAWAEAAGDAAAKHSKPKSLRKSVLMVNVDGSAWLYELTTKKKEILKKLEGSFKGKKPKDIRFRIGDVK